MCSCGIERGAFPVIRLSASPQRLCGLLCSPRLVHTRVPQRSGLLPSSCATTQTPPGLSHAQRLRASKQCFQFMRPSTETILANHLLTGYLHITALDNSFPKMAPFSGFPSPMIDNISQFGPHTDILPFFAPNFHSFNIFNKFKKSLDSFTYSFNHRLSVHLELSSVPATGVLGSPGCRPQTNRQTQCTAVNVKVTQMKAARGPAQT